MSIYRIPFAIVCVLIAALVANLSSCNSGDENAPSFRELTTAHDLNQKIFLLAKKWSEENEKNNVLYVPVRLIEPEKSSRELAGVFYSSSSLVVLRDGSIGVDLDVDKMIVALITDPESSESGFRLWSVWPKIELVDTKHQ